MQTDRDTSEPMEPVVRVLAPTGRDADLICRLLHGQGLHCETCDSLAALLVRLGDAGTGVAVVADETLTPEGTREVLATLERQPRWSDLPLIVLTKRGGPPRHIASLAARPSVGLLTRPIEATTLLSVVRAALESRRHQYEVRDMLAELRSLNARLDRRAGQLQRLALQLTQAEEAERRRLAVILHEDLQQLLAGVNFRLDTLPHQAGDPDALRQIVRELQETLRHAIQKSRGLSHELSPPILRQNELGTALEWLADRMEQVHGLAVEVEVEPTAEPQNDALVIFLFRAVQELLFNARKHAGIERATVRLRRIGHEVEIVVEDKGCGFDPAVLDARRSPPVGFGLFSIRERIALLGGRMEVQSTPGKGSRFRLTAPCRTSVDNNERYSTSGQAGGT